MFWFLPFHGRDVVNKAQKRKMEYWRKLPQFSIPRCILQAIALGTIISERNIINRMVMHVKTTHWLSSDNVSGLRRVAMQSSSFELLWGDSQVEMHGQINRLSSPQNWSQSQENLWLSQSGNCKSHKWCHRPVFPETLEEWACNTKGIAVVLPDLRGEIWEQEPVAFEIRDLDGTWTISRTCCALERRSGTGYELTLVHLAARRHEASSSPQA